MEALQEQLRVMEQERDTARATAQAQAAQAAVDLAAAQAATSKRPCRASGLRIDPSIGIE